MKIVTAKNGKQSVQISKKDWEKIGSDNGWMIKEAVSFDGDKEQGQMKIENNWVKDYEKATECLAYAVQLNPNLAPSLLGMDASEFLQRMRQNSDKIPTAVLNAFESNSPANLFS